MQKLGAVMCGRDSPYFMAFSTSSEATMPAASLMSSGYLNRTLVTMERNSSANDRLFGTCRVTDRAMWIPGNVLSSPSTPIQHMVVESYKPHLQASLASRDTFA